LVEKSENLLFILFSSLSSLFIKFMNLLYRHSTGFKENHNYSLTHQSIHGC
jgi:hypothetical protein